MKVGDTFVTTVTGRIGTTEVEEGMCCVTGCPNDALDHVSGCDDHMILKEDSPVKDSSVEDGKSLTDFVDDEQSFSEEMNDLADEVEEREWSQLNDRVDQHIRESRDVLKAEVLKVTHHERSSGDKVRFQCDVPTANPQGFYVDLPDGENSGERLYGVMNHLGVPNLRYLDMVEGMYLPVAYEGDEWNISLPSDEREGGWSWPSVSRPSMSVPTWLTVNSNVAMEYPKLAFSVFSFCGTVFCFGLLISVGLFESGNFVLGLVSSIITLIAGQGTRITFP